VAFPGPKGRVGHPDLTQKTGQNHLVPAIWLPDPSIRRERELARFRLHLVRHRTTLKNRIHATLITFGHPCPVSDLFGLAGRELLDRLAIPDPWRRNATRSLNRSSPSVSA
jgi:transposase